MGGYDISPKPPWPYPALFLLQRVTGYARDGQYFFPHQTAKRYAQLSSTLHRTADGIVSAKMLPHLQRPPRPGLALAMGGRAHGSHFDVPCGR